MKLLANVARAPHRAGFLSGTVVLCAGLLWWAAELLLRERGMSLLSSTPPALHGQVMLTGFFPLFMLGFIFTAGPKWLGVAPPSTVRWAMAIGLYGLGSISLLAATVWPLLGGIGSGAQWLGWGMACLIWLGRVRASQAPDRLHAGLILVAFVLGEVALTAYLLSGVAAWSGWRYAAQQGMLWGMLLPVYLVVCHRMVPFFTANAVVGYRAWRPDWLVASWVAGCWLHGALAMAGLPTLVVDGALALLLGWTVYRWQFWKTLRVRLLAMQHLAFVWAWIGMVLLVLEGVMARAGDPVSGLASLHALALGFMASMLLAFVTRVSLGHSGRALVAGRIAWYGFFVVQLVAVSRVLAEFLPLWRVPLLLVAIGCAVLVFGVWAWRYVPMYWQPRPDGREG